MTATPSTAAVYTGSQYPNLASRTSYVHAPHPLRPDYFLCNPTGDTGPPAAHHTDAPIQCRNCQRHPITGYRDVPDDKLREALTYIRSEKHIDAINAVLTERQHRRRVEETRRPADTTGGDPALSIEVTRPTRALTVQEWADVNHIRLNIARMREYNPNAAVRWHHSLNDTMPLPNPGARLRSMRSHTDAWLVRLRNAQSDIPAHQLTPGGFVYRQAPHPWCGSSSDRQSGRDPGHCEDCCAVGHVIAHPDYGCADVGCYRDHGSTDCPECGQAIAWHTDRGQCPSPL